MKVVREKIGPDHAELQGKTRQEQHHSTTTDEKTHGTNYTLTTTTTTDNTDMLPHALRRGAAFVPLAFGVLVISTMLASVGVNAGGTCERWSGEPTVCQQFGLEAGMWMFVPEWYNNGLENVPVNELNDLVVIATDRTNTAQLFKEQFGECYLGAMSLQCNGWLRRCVMEGQEPVAFPVQYCHQNCTDYMAMCTDLLLSLGNPPGVGLYKPKGVISANWTCDILDLDAQNTPFYQEENYTFTAPLALEPDSMVTVTSTCTIGEKVQDAEPICTAPLQVSEDRENCVFTCPLPSLDDSKYDALIICQAVFGWLSWVGSMFLSLSYLAQPRLRVFPANLVLMVALSAHVASLAFILPSFLGTEEVWCDGGVEFLPEVYLQTIIPGGSQDPSKSVEVLFDANDLLVKGSWCSVQGGILQFGFLAGTFWWAVVVFNIFLEVFFTNMKDWHRKSRIVIYHSVAWGMPAVFTIIPLAANRIAFPNSGSFCFISYEDSYAYQLVCWFIPVGILLLLGCGFFIASLTKLIPVFVKTPDPKKRHKLLHVYTRLLVFVLVQLGIYSFIFAYTIVTESNKDDISEGYNEYYSCLLFISYPDYPKDSCSLDNSVTNYPLIMLRALAFSSLGLLLFCNFLSSGILQFWSRMLRALKPRQGVSLTEIVDDVKLILESGSTDSVGTGTSRRKKSSSNDTSMMMTIDGTETIQEGME